MPTAWSVATLKSTRSRTTRAPKCLLTDLADKIAAWGSVSTTAHFLTRRDHRQGQVQRILVIRRLSRALLWNEKTRPTWPRLLFVGRDPTALGVVGNQLVGHLVVR